jgi:hypothetical protein
MLTSSAYDLMASCISPYPSTDIAVGAIQEHVRFYDAGVYFMRMHRSKLAYNLDQYWSGRTGTKEAEGPAFAAGANHRKDEEVFLADSYIRVKPPTFPVSIDSWNELHKIDQIADHVKHHQMATAFLQGVAPGWRGPPSSVFSKSTCPYSLQTQTQAC